MRKLIRRYRELSFEEKIVYKTIVGLCFSSALACGKLIVGIFTDYNLCSIAVYTFAILLSKLECVLGIKTTKRSFKRRNIMISVFLFVASIFYIGFMCRMFFIERKKSVHDIVYVAMIAFISFAELGFAIAGLIRTQKKGRYYRNIKIINFCMALIAILTTQMTILDFAATENTTVYNACTGIGVGGFIAICALYILLAPKISVTDRAHNVFVLRETDKNTLVDTESEKFEFALNRSRIYAPYVYRASVRDGVVDGKIERGASLWKRMHILLKILCCILSEILIFAWFIGRGLFFLRSVKIPQRLERIMKDNGFDKAEEPN